MCIIGSTDKCICIDAFCIGTVFLQDMGIQWNWNNTPFSNALYKLTFIHAHATALCCEHTWVKSHVLTPELRGHPRARTSLQAKIPPRILRPRQLYPFGTRTLPVCGETPHAPACRAPRSHQAWARAGSARLLFPPRFPKATGQRGHRAAVFAEFWIFFLIFFFLKTKLILNPW